MGQNSSRQNWREGSPACQDVGNMIHMEHINLNVPDPTMAAWFYNKGLGLAIHNVNDRCSLQNCGQDPSKEPELASNRVVWYNIGRQQFHIVHDPVAQVLQGRIHLYLAHMNELPAMLTEGTIATQLAGTHFSCGEIQPLSGLADKLLPAHIEVTCPWGNKFVIWEANPFAHAQVDSGIACIELPCAPGASGHIEAFYRTAMGAQTVCYPQGRKRGLLQDFIGCDIVVGTGALLAFYEDVNTVPAIEPAEQYTGWHIAFYVAKFSESYDAIAQQDLIFNEHEYSDKCKNFEDALTNQQFRFKDIVDPDGNLVFRFQHEVRSMYHPRFMVPLRNTCGFQKSFAAPLVDALPLNEPRPTSASGSKSCCFHNHNATECVPVALVDGSVALIDLP